MTLSRCWRRCPMPITQMGLCEDPPMKPPMFWLGPPETEFVSEFHPNSPSNPHIRHESLKPFLPSRFNNIGHPPLEFPRFEPPSFIPRVSVPSPVTSGSLTQTTALTVLENEDPPPFIKRENPSPRLNSPCQIPQNNPDPETQNQTTTSCASTINDSQTIPKPNPYNDIAVCQGCSGVIEDRFFLLAVEKRWHARCLRCVVCHGFLDSAATCFEKDGNIFCKHDYQRLFPQRRLCARCGMIICSSELVMRARDFIYHVPCFSCAQCQKQLTKGDHFGMSGALIYCKEHYQVSHMTEESCLSPVNISPRGNFSVGHFPPGPLIPGLPVENYPPAESIGKIQFFNGVGTPHKGRPRKRKPKEELMDPNLNLHNGYDMDGAFGSLGGSCQAVRNKRIRTSFKHHQLRTMKHYFNLNHNPDAKDLKQLSQKTNLSKRVLQVWFQNARAKWRRAVTMDKDPKLEGSTSECLENSGAEGSGPEYNSHSPLSAGTPLSPETPSECGSIPISYPHMF